MLDDGKRLEAGGKRLECWSVGVMDGSISRVKLQIDEGMWNGFDFYF